MNELLRNPVTSVWLLLSTATGVSWWMGSSVADGSGDFRYVSSALIVVALIKTRFVLRYFMEVRGAALPLRLLTDAWVLLVSAVLVTLYWHTV